MCMFAQTSIQLVVSCLQTMMLDDGCDSVPVVPSSDRQQRLEYGDVGNVPASSDVEHQLSQLIGLLSVSVTGSM